MRTRLLTALVLALALAGASSAQVKKDGTLALLYDVDSTSLTYCTLRGVDSSPWSDPAPVTARIKTTGSSTTVTEFTTGTNPFANVVVGDVLIIQTASPGGVSTSPTVVAVTARASAASISVDTAITLNLAAGNPFGYYHHVCGTTAADGWFAVPDGTKTVNVDVQYEQGDLGALVARWECKHAGAGAQPTILYPDGSANCGGVGWVLASDRCSTTTPGSRLAVVDDAPSYPFCRVGLAYVTSDSSDAGANLEKVTVKVSVR